MSACTTKLFFCVAAHVIVSSVVGIAQIGVPLPLDVKQLTAWKVSYPEWFDRWDTAETRCNIDDPTEYTRVRLDYDADFSMNDRSANRQIEVLDKRIVHHLKKHGWSVMKVEAGSGIPDLKRCFQKNNSIVQVYKTTGRCTANSPCNVYDGFTLTFYVPLRRD